ncbi:MAG: SprT-like family protein [Tepidisphaeraceae bacterium]|jgi:hypothetical protein
MVDLLAIFNPPEVISARFAQIHQAVLRESRCIGEENFRVIGTDDLALLFRLYEERFFDGWLSKAIASTAGAALTFRLSSTMTRAGGKTIRRRIALRTGISAPRYEIAIASRMLFMNFSDDDRPVTVCGLACTNRLTALQRIMEHEMLHLAEMLVWGKSSCSAPRFKSMAVNVFGHADTRHELVTPRERAEVRHAVKIGSKVEFEIDGKRIAGLVNRIHHRATVLVESPGGMRYRDGKTYLKYYVPLPMLRVEGAESAK